jgi:alkanesulfonate monooxygenase SsuD/methylene tetrahydromethanopterin reductase-like flavin-dependent oxidoreductase (luciferase family)
VASVEDPAADDDGQRRVRIGVGLPAAVPGTAATTVGEWAAHSERLGFRSVGVLDRLVYDNLDPLMALAAAAERTERVELLTTVLTVPYRQNAVVLAKQLASLDELSGGRLTTGLALGGWPEDFAASQVPVTGRGKTFEAMLATMRRVWSGEVEGAAGPMPALAAGRPGLLIGGLVAASFARVARLAEGWVAPFFGYDTLREGITGARRAWEEAGRAGRPRIVAARYFCLGAAAKQVADEYLLHYYGREYFAAARADTSTGQEELEAELSRLAAAGCDDVVLFPCSGDLGQLDLLRRTSEDLRPL